MEMCLNNAINYDCPLTQSSARCSYFARCWMVVFRFP